MVGRAGNCAVTNYFYDSVLRFFAAILSLLNCSFMPRNSHHVRQSWQTTKASFHNGSVIVLKGGIRQLRGLNSTQFWPPTLFEWTIVDILHFIYTSLSMWTFHDSKARNSNFDVILFFPQKFKGPPTHIPLRWTNVDSLLTTYPLLPVHIVFECPFTL